MLITVAIPCYRSAETLPNVVGRIKDAFKLRPEFDYEIILANDGSPDNTYDVIKTLCAEDGRVKGINLSRNYGQGKARYAALAYARGDIVVCMDDDGQHPPEQIFRLIDKVREGYDVVYAAFAKKKESLPRRITSRIHTRILRWTIKKPRDLKVSAFYAMDRLIADKLRDNTSPFPATLGYMLSITSKIVNVPIDHQLRIAGTSGYNFKKRFMLWLDGFVNFSVEPLRMASFVGFITALVGIAAGIMIVVRRLFNQHIALGYTSIIATILFVGGMIMIMLGLLGEYVGRIFIVMSNAPQFVVREAINVEEDER